MTAFSILYPNNDTAKQNYHIMDDIVKQFIITTVDHIICQRTSLMFLFFDNILNDNMYS